MDDEIKNRLHNWKFAEALKLAEVAPNMKEQDKEDIRQLSAMFGDSGWFFGSIGELVQAVVIRLTGGEDDDEGR